MAERIEDYALLGDLQTAALVGRSGSVDWLPFPRFDSSSCFGALLGSSEHGRWLLAPRGQGRRPTAATATDTLILESEWQTDTGRVRVIDFMPPRETKPDIVRIVEGLEGTVQMRTELVIRFDYGSVIPWVRRRRLERRWSRSAARTVSSCARRSTSNRTGMTHTAEFTVRAGERVPVRADVVPLARGAPEPVDAEDALADTETFWRDWLRDCALRGRVRAGRAHVARRAEGPDVPADRWNRRRADDLAAGAHRRSPQLGLPLLLVARRDVHALRADERRLHRGGEGVARLVAALGGR